MSRSPKGTAFVTRAVVSCTCDERHRLRRDYRACLFDDGRVFRLPRMQWYCWNLCESPS